MDDLADSIRKVMERFFANIAAAHANSPGPLDIVRLSFPFDVRPEHQVDVFHYALREHGDFVATGGRDWHDDRRRGLRSFYAMLRQEDLVITYSPVHGWAAQERFPGDNDLIVRIEDPTVEQRRIWRFLREELAP